MGNFLNNRWAELFIRYIMGITFIYASIHKIITPAEFAKIIYGYGLFPHILINLMAIVIPFLEFVAGAALLLGFYPKAAGALICAMLLVFITAISINLLRGYEFDCGCFSFSSHTDKFSTQFLLIRDAFFFLICGYSVRFNGKRLWSLMKNGR